MPIMPKRKTLIFLSRLALGLLSLVLVFGTALPFLRSDAWWIRIFDFPRIQIAALMGLTLGVYVVLHLYGTLRRREYALAAVVGLGLVWQLYAIAPYTTFYPRQMSDSRAENDANRISLLIYNVRYDNHQVEALRDLIRDNDPDMILLSETNPWWLEKLDGLEDDYPYTLFQPQENQYGLLLYSRLEMENPEIRFLIEPEIPSIRTKVRLRSGTVVTLYGVHPRPPGIRRPGKEQDSGVAGAEEGEDEDGERQDSDMRDAELMVIAKEVKKLEDVPIIVAGDFNDVAWSHTMQRFQRMGGLLDPRVGRGFFNTFNTKSRLLRFPLDGVFASQHFRLVTLRRLPDIGSDHFPMLAVLDYDSSAGLENEEPQPKAGDQQEADAAIDKKR